MILITVSTSDVVWAYEGNELDKNAILYLTEGIKKKIRKIKGENEVVYVLGTSMDEKY